VPLRRPRLLGERAHAPRLELLRLKVRELFDVRAVVAHVVAVAHELKILRSVIRGSEIQVMNDRPLPFERRDTAEQTAARHEPVDALARAGRRVLD
jgi:hypothetical protein